jgi:hypothetical protein
MYERLASHTYTSKIGFMRIILTCVLFVYLAACTSKIVDSNVYFEEGDLPPLINLEGEKLNIQEIINPRGLMIKDGLAVVYERKNNNDNKFHIIDLDSKKYLASKGIDGLGPGEVTVISQIEDTGELNKIWVYDSELRKFSKFDLRDSSKLAEEQFRSPETTVFMTATSWVSGNSLLGNPVDGWGKYIHINTTGDTLALFGDWNDMIKGKELQGGIEVSDLDANLISNIFQGTLKGSPDKRFFVKAGIGVDYIDIITIENHSIKTIYGPDNEIPEFSIGYWDGFQMPQFERDVKDSYLDVYPGTDTFFVLYFGKPYKELGSSNNLNRIFEFDYEGNIINQFQLDYPIYGFAVDEENRAIYGVTVDSEPNLVKFDY